MKYRIIKKHISTRDDNFLKCKELCLISKNLRNKALSIINNHYANNVIEIKKNDITKQYHSYQITPEQAEQNGFTLANNSQIYSLNVLYHLLKNTPEFRCFMNEKSVNTKALKQTLKSVNEEYVGYCKALKEYWINPDKFRAKPNPPGFKGETEQYKMTFPSDAISCKTKKKIITLGNSEISIPMFYLVLGQKIREIEITPSRNGYVLNICLEDKRKYIQLKDMVLSSNTIDNVVLGEETRVSSSKCKIPKFLSTRSPNFLSIDLGVKHLGMMVCNYSDSKNYSTMIGTGINFLNRKTWHKTDELRRKLPKGIDDSRKIADCEAKRNRRMHTLMHTYSKRVVEYCLLNGISKVIIGNNPGWKNSVNLGRNTNRKFYGIPHGKFKSMLEYKLVRHGIECVFQEESYTSKSSFMDDDYIPVFNRKSYDINRFSGKRKSRGLYVTGKGHKLNADVNGALNIMRKNISGRDIFEKNRCLYAVNNPKHILPHVKLLSRLIV